MKKSQETVLYPVRVKRELKDAFIDCCKNQDTDGAREIRAFMRVFIQKHGQQKLI